MKISKNNGQEYELWIQTAFGDFICDSYPLDLENTLYFENVDFFTLYAKNIFLSHEDKYSIYKTTDEGHRLCGVLFCQNQPLAAAS